MAALTPTNSPNRHVLGDVVWRDYDLSGNNGDTFSVPVPETIMQVVVTPTTAISIGVTRSFNVATFVTSGAWAARISIVSRIG
jgi:hypothetical protein